MQQHQKKQQYIHQKKKQHQEQVVEQPGVHVMFRGGLLLVGVLGRGVEPPREGMLGEDPPPHLQFSGFPQPPSVSVKAADRGRLLGAFTLLTHFRRSFARGRGPRPPPGAGARTKRRLCGRSTWTPRSAGARRRPARVPPARARRAADPLHHRLFCRLAVRTQG